MAKLTAAEVCPSELAATIAAEPLLSTRFAGTFAVNCAEETKLVASGDPFHRMTEVFWNPLPFTVSAKAGEPATADVGLSVEISGGGAVMVKLDADEN